MVVLKCYIIRKIFNLFHIGKMRKESENIYESCKAFTGTTYWILFAKITKLFIMLNGPQVKVCIEMLRTNFSRTIGVRL